MEKGIFISPFVDRGFKILFGQENSKELLIDLLNDLLEGERHIENLEYMNNELPPETADGRTALFDLRCKDKDGSIFWWKCKIATSLIFMNVVFIIFVGQ